MQFGALQWQERGLSVPDKVASASAEYFDDEDTLGQFLQDETLSEVGAFISANSIHQRFTQWCDLQGLHPWTQRTLIVAEHSIVKK